MKRVFLYLAIPWFAFILLGHLYYFKTGDFQTSYLLEAQDFSKAADPRWLKALLQRKYFYFGQGNQTYAFLSEDGNHILKLFKKDYLQRRGWTSFIPPIFFFRSLFLHQGNSRKKRQEKLLRGYEVGFLHDRKNSGLLYYSSCKAKNGGRLTTLVTGIGQCVAIDLNNYVFAVQVKVSTTKHELSSLLSKGKVADAKICLRKILHLYFEGYAKGIIDNDHNLLKNTGFYKGRAVRQDVGKIIRKSTLKAWEVKKDLEKIRGQRLGPWLRKNFPSHASSLEKIVENDIQNYLLGRKFSSWLLIQSNNPLLHFLEVFCNRPQVVEKDKEMFDFLPRVFTRGAGEPEASKLFF